MTVDQIKQKFRQNGMTFKQWALDHGYKYNKVIRVINGFDKGHRGAAHTISVQLGMKIEILHSMKKQSNPLNQQCAKALGELRTAGISVSQWSRDNGYSRNVVASVLYGRSACMHGIAHEVAVALGIKAGRVVKPGSFKPRVKAVDAARASA